MKDYLTVVEFAAAGITKQAVYKRIKQDLAPSRPCTLCKRARRKKDYIKIADMKKTLQ